MSLLNIRGHMPNGTQRPTIIVLNTEKVSFIAPPQSGAFAEVHCSGSYFLTDKVGVNLILAALRGDDGFQGGRDIQMSAGYENIAEY